MKRLLQSILVLVSTLIVTFAIIELCLRWFIPIYYRPLPSEISNIGLSQGIIYQKSDIPGLDYELVSSTEAVAYDALVRTNSYGMRGDEPDPSKDRNVLVLGDSFSFGNQVAQEKIYPSHLDKELQKKDKNYQVLNLGTAGYSTKDEATILHYNGARWTPEIIIVGYVLNDPEIEPIHDMHAYFREPSWWQYSHVLRLFAQGKKRLDILSKGQGDYYQYLHADRTSWQSVIDGFADIKKEASKSNAEVIVVIFPDTLYAWNKYPYKAIHEQVKALADMNGFRAIDLIDYYSKYSPGDLRVSENDAHPNELAHAVATQAILENWEK